MPLPRGYFCVVLISARDNSSHNIYLYGGTGPGNVNFDDVYILSLPSFTRTQVYGPSTSPRWGHTCHVAGRQMITVGGMSTSVPCDWESKGVAVLDLSTILWGSVYNANNVNYTVPNQVLATIGGANGTTTMKQPKGGFDDPQLAQLFGLRNVTNAAVARHQHTNTGAIAGSVVGGLAGAALLVLALVMVYRRKSKAKAVAKPETNGPAPPFADPALRS